MKVNVKLFGPFALMSGRREFSVQTDQEALSVEEFLFLLAEKLPAIRKPLGETDMGRFLNQRVLLVINGVPCFDKSKPLREDDQIHVLTPLAGG